MLDIDGVPVVAGVDDILYRLKRELALDGKQVFNIISNKNNNYMMVTCPYHNNLKAPDMQISKRKTNKYEAGFAYCHGCHKSVSLVELVSNMLGYNDFGVAGKKWIFDRFATFELDSREGIFQLPSRNKKHVEKKYVSKTKLATYRYTHPYMYKRYLTDYIIDWYDIGYDKDTNSITFPVKDEDGNCLFVAERSVNYKHYHYPKDVDKPLYGIFELKHLFPNTKEVYICESMLNVMTLAKYGIPAIGLLGTGSSNQYELLKNLPYRKYVIATDNDVAGDLGCDKLIYQLGNYKLLSRFIVKDKGYDINDLGYCKNKEEFISHCKEIELNEIKRKSRY